MASLLTPEDLGSLIGGLRELGFQVIGPTRRDGAIVKDLSCRKGVVTMCREVLRQSDDVLERGHRANPGLQGIDARRGGTQTGEQTGS